MSDQDNVVNEPAEEVTAPAESTPEETKEPEAKDDPITEELKSDDDKPSVNETETDKPEEPAPKEEPESPKEEETETEEKPSKATERKQQLNTEIRGLVEQRKALREEIEQLNGQVYQPQTAEELQQEGLSADQARLAAIEQRIELDKYNNQVVEAQMALGEQSQRVLQDFPMFNPDSEEYDPEIAAQAAEALEDALIQDPNTGQVIGAKVSPYKIYKPIADAYKKSKVQGQLQGQKATEQMLSRAEGSTSTAPIKPKEDPVLSILKSDDY